MQKSQSRLWKLLAWILDVAVAVDLVAIVIASVLIIKYQTYPPNQTDIAELFNGILAVLLLVAVGGIWDRIKRLHRIEEATQQTKSLLETKVIQRIRADEFFETNNRPTSEFLATASNIAISGITLGNTTRDFSNVIGQRLVAGACVKLMMVDATDEALNQVVARSWSNPTTEYYKKRLENTSALISIIAGNLKPTGTLEIGYLPFVPSFGIVMVDPESPTGALYVEIYHHNVDKPFPRFRLTVSKDLYWFQFFKEQFELMWKRCRVQKIVEKTETAPTATIPHW